MFNLAERQLTETKRPILELDGQRKIDAARFAPVFALAQNLFLAQTE